MYIAIYILISFISFFYKLPILQISISIFTRFFAAIIGILLYKKFLEKKIIVFVVLFFLMAFRQTLTLMLWTGVLEKNSITHFFSELPGYFVTLLSLIAIIYMGRILNDDKEIIFKQAEKLNKLHRLLPICARCKKIRDSEGYWNKIEKYFAAQSGIKFSHGLCDDCYKKLYGDQPWFRDLEKSE